MKLCNIEQFLKKREQEKAYDSYAVLVSVKGKEKLFTSINVNEETLFDVASIGKVMPTSTLAVRAVSEGKINLEDTLEMYFQDVPEDKKRITIKNLLTHTSGIISGLIPDRVADTGKDAVVDFILSGRLRFEPGSSFEYSCFGYILLGFILEKIYGMTLDQLFHKYIAEPLGFKRSQYVLPLDAENAAICYRSKYPGKRREDGERAYTLGYAVGSGACHSCIYDLKRFCEAILNKNEILYPKEWFDIAETDYTTDYSVGRGLGYLIERDEPSGKEKLFSAGSIGHDGHTGTGFYINREKETYVIILTNATRFANMKNDFKFYDYDEVKKLRQDIRDMILEDLKNENLV